jgi:HK97 family phage major capsid protein
VYRDLSVGSGAAYPGSTGGYFIAPLFVAKVEAAMKFYSRLFALANVVDTQTGAPQGYPQDNDATIAGEMVAEFSQTNEQDVLISLTTLKSFKFGSRITKVSMELLQDAGFPLDDYLADRFAIRLARAMNPRSRMARAGA